MAIEFRNTDPVLSSDVTFPERLFREAVTQGRRNVISLTLACLLFSIGMWRGMLFIALAKFKTKLSKDVVEQNLKDIEADTKGQVRYLNVYWTLGRYDTVVIFEAPDEKVAMNMVLKRADRMEIETLVAVPADAESPAGPV